MRLGSACRKPTFVHACLLAVARLSLSNRRQRTNLHTEPPGQGELYNDWGRATFLSMSKTVPNATVCAVKGGNALAIVDSEPFHTHSISLFQSVRVTIRSSGCYTDGLAHSHASHHIHNR